MYSDKEFRTVLFGGYSKEDVQEYLKTIEKDSEVAKFGYQSEITELKAELEKSREEKDKLEEIARRYRGKLDEFENKKMSSQTETEIYVEELKKQKTENENLRHKFAELQGKTRILLEENRHMEKELEKLNGAGISSEKNMQLEDEMQQLKEEKEKYQEDVQAIKKVLKDARMSAEYIKEEARKEAEGILNQAQKESRDLIEQRKTQIDQELEDRGIRFMAAKYKMEAYRKEINDTQQKLYNLYSDMGKMIDGMPTRLEQLWNEDDHLKILEKKESASQAELENKGTDSVQE